LREAVSSARAAQAVPAVVRVAVNAKDSEAAKEDEKAQQVQDEETADAETISVFLPAPANSVKVPSLIGMPVRKVVEEAALAGLNLQVTGRGMVRSQEPVAGTPVQPGAQIVVHCGR